MAPQQEHTTPDTLITIKITINDLHKKLKLPLRDLGAAVLPDKLRHVLSIKPDQHMVLERYSDSSGSYITLDASNPAVFKTLMRAAKAKLKLRLKITVTPPAEVTETAQKEEAETSENHPSENVEPVTNSTRESSALDQRSVGSGIFQFRQNRASQSTMAKDPSTACGPSGQHNLTFRLREAPPPASFPVHAWSVYCNACDKAMDNEHFHCSICDGGDYDLCQGCVNAGKLCRGEGHWLIKRFIQNGKVVNSTTERVCPRKPAVLAPKPVETEMPGAFTDDTKTLAEELRTPTRTCNNCVVVLPEQEFVTCTTCNDFDLCIPCHTADDHGHHPGHGFERAAPATVLALDAQSKLAPGRNVRHNAICDGCDSKIYGIRHKCLNCPDWDYCNNCIADASTSHPRHRFATLYHPIADQTPNMVRHFGIYCDGPLCSKRDGQWYIQGVRYKCTVCHDTDFCEACEAVPHNQHNRTHPLIKFKTPVRHVNVSTENEDVRGNVRVMGDRRTQPAVSTKSIATETNPVPINTATLVQTVADFQPTDGKKTETQPVTIPVKKFVEGAPSTLLNAVFVRDSIPDGTVFTPEERFTQVWTMTNPGPNAWPAGCSVRCVGGDNMLNVDNRHPASVLSLTEATESNVVGREVQPGEEVAFKVTLKAPVREGKSISYWRLKSAHGTPFGHRLWCDIEVKKSEVQPPQPTTPEALKTFQEAQVQYLASITQNSLLNTSTGMPPSYDHTELSARLAMLRERQRQTQPESQHSTASAMPRLGGKSLENMTEEERREALEQRVANIAANIVKLRQGSEKKVEQPIVNRIAEPETATKNVDDVEEQEEAGEALEGSQMVFPKLDKESPASSTYQSAASTEGKAAYVENEDGEVEHSAAPAAREEFVDLDDDEIEVLSAAGDDMSDDGFVTDEEYDILDASDEETVVSKA